MSGMEIRAVIYARVSTEEQAEKGYSIEGQIEDCFARAKSFGYVDGQIAVLTDDMSGGLLERPGLNRLREMVASRYPPERIIIYDPDRFARKLAHQLLVTDEIVRRGVLLEFVNFEWKNTPEGRMFYQLRGMFAEFEREKIRERTIRGRLTKLKRHGKLSGDPRIFGYRFDVERDVLTVDDEESRVVQLMFDWCANGSSGEQIARRLAKDGIPAPRGSVWYGSTVTRILRNRTYLGTFMAYKTDYHQGFRRSRPADEQIPVPVDPLVDPATFEKAQRTLDKHRTRTGRPPERVYLLSGLAACACGCSVAAGTVSGARKRAYYSCSSKRKRGYGASILTEDRSAAITAGEDASPAGRGADRCESPYWNVEIVDELVWHQIRSAVESGEELLDRWMIVHSGHESDSGSMLQLTILIDRRTTLKKQLDRLLDLFLSGGLERNAFEEKRIELEEKLLSADRAIEELNAGASPHADGLSPILPGEGGAALRQALDQAGPDLRKKLADLLLDRVILGPGRDMTIVFSLACLSGKTFVGEGDGGL